jgi:hypothetical protein
MEDNSWYLCESVTENSRPHKRSIFCVDDIMTLTVPRVYNCKCYCDEWRVWREFGRSGRDLIDIRYLRKPRKMAFKMYGVMTKVRTRNCLNMGKIVMDAWATQSEVSSTCQNSIQSPTELPVQLRPNCRPNPGGILNVSPCFYANAPWFLPKVGDVDRNTPCLLHKQ